MVSWNRAKKKKDIKETLRNLSHIWTLVRNNVLKLTY